MKIFSAAAALSLASSSGIASAANANPFAPKMTRNTPQSSYIGSLMAKATPTPNSQLRRLDDADQEIDISSYSIKFEKCQYIKQYADERNENIDSVLETKRFVIFRLCPNNSCGSSSCNYNYGEYLVDMETYLESTLQHKQEEQENYCQACEECAEEADDDANANDDGGRRAFRRKLYNVDCSSCYAQCQNIENMEDNGYADASEYVTCAKVYENENTGVVYYAGALCANYGTRIKVGLFTDEYCSVYDSSAAIDKYLKNGDGYNVKLSYHLLKQTFASDECVASCTKVNEDASDDDANNDDANAEVETAEVCENLYEAAGKCENPHGFESGMDYSNSEYYDVQSANEESVCDFITTMSSGTYDETGEVVIQGGSKTILASTVQTTGGQKFALTFFVIGTVGLAAYAALLHQKISKGGNNADLSEQGDGTMA
mmetsp:Transcript_8319/g.18642  ORF Transcript_8319/g.18642 Transcript_8319/m.18642 type:complete len:432 (+) Transcript_8319:85-1380(+)